jgi:hypothetical protein
MRTFKAVLGVIGALIPVLYFGYLAYYFFDVGGSVEEVQTIGLGPTVMGLAIVVLLFCIPLFFKMSRLFGGPRSPKSGGDADRPASTDESGFDVDAAIARYMARQAAQPAPVATAAAPSRKAPEPVKGPSFGRKSR